jgi:hypothetical protein
MQTKRFIYTGPDSAVTLKVPDAQGVMVDLEVILWSGRAVDLPVDHEYVQTLSESGVLVPTLDAVTSSLKTKSSKATSASQVDAA